MGRAYFQNLPCCKIGQGHPRVIIWSNYNGLESQMLYTKFHENWHAGSGAEDFWVVFTIYHYGRGGHLGHVTWISLSNFRPFYPWMLHIKFHFDWPIGFREDLWKVFMDARPTKVKRWPWPKLITYLHLLHYLFASTTFQVSACNSFQKIHFSSYKSMETLSCHSNQCSGTRTIKNANFVEAYIISMYAKFQLHPPYSSCEENFWIFFSKIYPLRCYSNQTNKAILTKVALNREDYAINIYVKTKFQYPQINGRNCNFPLFAL